MLKSFSYEITRPSNKCENLMCSWTELLCFESNLKWSSTVKFKKCCTHMANIQWSVFTENHLNLKIVEKNVYL